MSLLMTNLEVSKGKATVKLSEMQKQINENSGEEEGLYNTHAIGFETIDICCDEEDEDD